MWVQTLLSGGKKAAGIDSAISKRVAFYRLYLNSKRVYRVTCPLESYILLTSN